MPFCARQSAHVAVVLLVGGVVAGCAAPLPTYDIQDPREALRVMADRAAQVRTVTGSGGVRLTDAEGRGVELDAALAAEPPDRLRLRAWKMGSAVLDATLVEHEVWIAASEDPRAGAAREQADAVSRGLLGAMELLSPVLLRDAEILDPGSARGTLTALVRTSEGEFACTIDRRTLTARECRGRSPGNRGLKIGMGSYRVVDGVAWPMRLRLESPAGRVEVRLNEVELNAELPEGAFTPPARAEKHR